MPELSPRQARAPLSALVAVTLLSLLATLLALAATVPAHATGTARHTLDAEWGRANLVVKRTGWNVSVGGTMTDKRADGDCIYVEAVLAVDDYTDPDDRSADFCGGKGKTTSITGISMTPGKGSRLASVRIRICAADWGKDSCKEMRYAVPSEVAKRPDLKGKVDGYMNGSMRAFLKAKKSGPKPFNWVDDGCTSSPDGFAQFNFKNACARHDFGYRNYGNGAVMASPTDATRKAVDDRLKSDMQAVCNGYGSSRKVQCQGLAQAYYQAVRKAGGPAFY